MYIYICIALLLPKITSQHYYENANPKVLKSLKNSKGPDNLPFEWEVYNN